jgi:sulfite exporter TauE/SafE
MLELATAFLVGLLGGAHCLGMCGGIAATLTLGLPKEKRLSWRAMLPYQLAYNSARIVSYSLAGMLMGGFGFMLEETSTLRHTQSLLLLLAGVLMVLMGLYIGGWWNLLNHLERAGGRIWQGLQPLARRLLPVRTPAQAFSAGLIWGWLPCGLVYSTLIWSMSAGGPLQGALLMAAFGLGTLPNLLSMGLALGSLSRWFRKPRIKQTAGALVVLMGLITLSGLFR